MTFVSKRHSQRPLVVTLVPLPTSPTPVRPEKRRLATLPAKAEPQRVSAPSPIVPTPSEPIVIVSNVPSPPSPPVVERQPDPTPSGPVAVNDLATRLISATPPRYPMQSRHDHESGVVTLLVTLGEDGSVETVSISQSSGYKRLDAAASGAVRKWRWSPTMINGRAVRIQGLVRIPFELREGAP